ncbi:MAG: CapA family protein [candidate division WOR-3 bacterium]|nr:CapA family protein [candidate division WOR-3 bacterium]
MTSRTQIHSILILLLLLSAGISDSLTIVAVGDIMMGSNYPVNMLPPNDGKDLYEDVADILSSGDLTIGNLEGVIMDGGVCAKKTEKGKVYAFRTPPSYAWHLSEAGFDFMNLANNHMNDFGPHGVESSKQELAACGIVCGGFGGEIGRFEINGVNIAIACFATSPGADVITDIIGAQRKVARLARANDVVIVSFHGGGEGLGYLHTRDTFEYFLGQPRGNVVEFSRAVVDSGADFVWGHGPHVPRAIEIYNSRLIAYSLGNFCTWGFNIGEERGYAPMLRIVVDSTGVLMRGEIVSALQKPDRSLVIDEQHNAARLMARLSRQDFPESAPYITETGSIVAWPENREDR